MLRSKLHNKPGVDNYLTTAFLLSTNKKW